MFRKTKTAGSSNNPNVKQKKVMEIKKILIKKNVFRRAIASEWR